MLPQRSRWTSLSLTRRLWRLRNIDSVHCGVRHASRCQAMRLTCDALLNGEDTAEATVSTAVKSEECRVTLPENIADGRRGSHGLPPSHAAYAVRRADVAGNGVGCFAVSRRTRYPSSLKSGPSIPSAASSLRNPKSYRARLRAAQRVGAEQSQHFEEQVLHTGQRRRPAKRRRENDESDHQESTAAEGVTPFAASPEVGSAMQRRRRQRAQRGQEKVGQAIFEKCKYLSDSEWEGVAMEDKHAFTKYMSKMLREHPTQTTEQQRRRYFETTMLDPRDLDPSKSVKDEYERIKLGLPVQLRHPTRQLGVTQAAFELSEASLFDPAKANELEDYMHQIKQLFADYVRHRREGRSTEMERRRLANMTREFQEETQKHLGNLFKYAEEKVRRVAQEERRTQLEWLESLKRELRARKAAKHHHPTTPSSSQVVDSVVSESGDSTPSTASGSDPSDLEGAAVFPTYSASAYRKGTSRAAREKSVKRFLRRALGVDPDVARSLWTELEAQTRFMQFCEVFARLTTGSGFRHSAADERLDDYTQRIKKLYSADAQAWGTLEVVQYLAAKDAVPPVEWAKEWYERALKVPLQKTPEYQQLESIRQEECEALEAQRDADKARRDLPNDGEGEGLMQLEEEPIDKNDCAATDSLERDTAASPAMTSAPAETSRNPPPLPHTTPAGGDGAAATEETTSEQEKALNPVMGHRLAHGFSLSAVEEKQKRAMRLVEKMFLKPEDPRLETLHEKRLRYLAYVQMEEQIQQARDNAKRFAGVEETAPEAAECRELYQALLERGSALRREEAMKAGDNAPKAAEDTSSPLPPHLFEVDPEARRLFESIRNLVLQVIHRCEKEPQDPSRSEKRLHKLKEAMAHVQEQLSGPKPSDAMRAQIREEKASLAERLLRLAEKDIQEELRWLDDMEEMQRPPLLPVPEAGMSYCSAADVQAWKQLRHEQKAAWNSPFAASSKRRVAQQLAAAKDSAAAPSSSLRAVEPHRFHASFLGQPWEIPDKPTLFWGTGTKAVQQALEHAAEEANWRRREESLLPPPYPCAANPWGWRLVKDILDD